MRGLCSVGLLAMMEVRGGPVEIVSSRVRRKQLHKTLDGELVRSAVVLYPYVRRLSTFGRYTLRDFVDSFKSEADPSRGLKFWRC